MGDHIPDNYKRDRKTGIVRNDSNNEIKFTEDEKLTLQVYDIPIDGILLSIGQLDDRRVDEFEDAVLNGEWRTLSRYSAAYRNAFLVHVIVNRYEKACEAPEEFLNYMVKAMIHGVVPSNFVPVLREPEMALRHIIGAAKPTMEDEELEARVELWSDLMTDAYNIVSTKNRL